MSVLQTQTQMVDILKEDTQKFLVNFNQKKIVVI